MIISLNVFGLSNEYSNAIDVSQGTLSGQMEFTAKGHTYENLLDEMGSFKKDSNGDGVADGWNDTSYTFPSWSNGVQTIRADGTNQWPRIQYYSSGPITKSDSYYFVTGELKVTDVTGISYVKITPNGSSFYDTSTAVSSAADLSKVNEWQIAGTKFKTSPEGVMSKAYVIVLPALQSDSINDQATVQIKNIGLYEITTDDYNNLSIQELNKKYSYIENKSSVESFEIKSTGKNLCNNEWEVGFLTWEGGFECVYPERSRSALIEVSSNSDYIASNSNVSIYAFEYDKDMNYLGWKDASSGMKTSECTSYIRLAKATSATSNSEIQFEKGTTATTYETYIESRTTINLPNGKSLKSVNGVYDEISNNTFIQRIGDDYTVLSTPVTTYLTYNPVMIFENGSIFITRLNQSSNSTMPYMEFNYPTTENDQMQSLIEMNARNSILLNELLNGSVNTGAPSSDTSNIQYEYDPNGNLTITTN